jgi:hypothetical protein
VEDPEHPRTASRSTTPSRRSHRKMRRRPSPALAPASSARRWSVSGEGRGGGGIGGEGREAARLEVSREGREAVGGLGGETRELGLQPFIYYTSTITAIGSWMNG